MTRDNVRTHLIQASINIGAEEPATLVENLITAALEIIVERKALAEHGSVTAIAGANSSVLIEVNPPPCFNPKPDDGSKRTN